MTSDYFVIDKRKVVHDTIDGETVVINLDSGMYYALNATATLIWNWINQGADRDKILELLLKHFPRDQSELDTDLRSFIEKLMNQDLLLNLQNPISDGNPTAWFSLEAEDEGDLDYLPPEFSLFDDMADFLKVDPIHEVTEQGWPYTENSENQDRK